MSVRPVEVAASLNGVPPTTGSSLHRFANPGRFLRLSQRLLPWLVVPAVVLTVTGLGWGLFFAPADWQQGDAVRIMYVHVPSAWLASSGYFALAICSLLSLVWRHPLADLAAVEIGPVGAGFTALCLASGSLWGKPMWGAWWVWDARLTSVLVLFFLYIGHIVLVRAFDDPVRGYRAGSILALVGVINLPIIKFSVDWWNTLHQPASIGLLGAPSMAPSMLWPLLISALGFSFAFAAIVVARLRAAVMERRIRGLLLARAGSRCRTSRSMPQPMHSRP
jgi:heme exporter protein C